MNFDRLAGSYDSLARLVFGKSIINAQVSHFSKIPERSRVLIIGGGTGSILEYLPPGIKSIDYVEPSSKMIAKSKSRETTGNINFTQCRIEDFKSQEQYDVIITNFFLDLYDEESLSTLIPKLQNRLKRKGLWIVTDFYGKQKIWQSLLLRVMYRFFRLTSGLYNQQLPDWKQILSRSGLVPLSEIYFYRGFIHAICYC
jgi:2-polyprenyl-3-methyl-5-hydroxy-6-metoxy-1,4-benzoquinol methylase